jgi:phosphonate transport system ATP-binding protein
MIELRSVSVVYSPGGRSARESRDPERGFAALSACSLAFERGQFTVLLGPSGAGKSTLLRCLNLLVEPTSGEVHCPDLGPLNQRRTLQIHRRRTGMVFQQHHLIARHTALQNVEMGRLGYQPLWRSFLPVRSQNRLAAVACLERVGLLNKALERADRLSGGEQQRVGIARALFQRPDLMLADEPVASLDPSTARKVLAVLQQVCREDGITAVVSLHQVDLARDFADRIIALNRGRVVFDGAPHEMSAAALSDIYAAAEPIEIKETNA